MLSLSLFPIVGLMNAKRSGTLVVFIVALLGFSTTRVKNSHTLDDTEPMPSDLEGSISSIAHQDVLTEETEDNTGLSYLLHKPPQFQSKEKWPLLVIDFSSRCEHNQIL
jgi:hypothetical protein